MTQETTSGAAERFCECPLPCPCNVPFEGRAYICPECKRGNHMDPHKVTPGHIVPRSVAGSLEEADKWPVVPQCERHNTEVDSNVELRRWAISHRFRWVDGAEYRYRYNRVDFEREL